MAGEFLLTIGDSSQLEDIFQGDFLKGHGEPRIMRLWVPAVRNSLV
jgi:hypothetical protein